MGQIRERLPPNLRQTIENIPQFGIFPSNNVASQSEDVTIPIVNPVTPIPPTLEEQDCLIVASGDDLEIEVELDIDEVSIAASSH
jgi:hypothetical protein